MRIAYSKRHAKKLIYSSFCLPLALIIGCSHQEQQHNKTSNTLDTLVVSPNTRPETYQNACDASFKATSDAFHMLEDGTFKNSTDTFLNAVNDLDRQLGNALGKNGLFSAVHPEGALRSAAETCQQRFVSLLSEIGLSRPIYDQFTVIDTSGLPKADKRFVENQILALKRSGVSLSKEKRQKVKQLNNAILELGQAFSKKTREDVRTTTFPSVDALDGLPQDYIDAHPPAEDGSVTLTTNYPDYVPFMTYAHNDDARFKMYKTYRQRAYPQNDTTLMQLIKKRHELATLLGYKNYAKFVTEDLMIKTPENAANFIDKINTISTERAAREYDAQLTLLRKSQPDATAVGDWQKTYLAQQLKKQKYDVDAQEVRQYFSYKNVQQGIFGLAEQMFAVEITPWDTPVWHNTVQAFEMKENGKTIGRFYLDMHPRDGKYKHAAAFTINSGVKGMQLPLIALVCNFPGDNNPDALLEHGQVETFLHEFGHLLHGIFGGHQKWATYAGTGTERDFVEAPSQMLEEWVWDAETLKTFARNHKGETIPDELIKKMRSARSYGKGLFTRHQMYYASVSLDFYSSDPDSLNMVETLKTNKAKYSNYGYVEDTYFHATFGHLYGYSAVYYSYMWSLVMALDMFSEFEKKGLRNTEIAKHYRDTILAPGGSKNADELVRDFLGRDYSFDAFAKSLK